MNWEQQVKKSLSMATDRVPQAAAVDRMCARMSMYQMRRAYVKFGIFCVTLIASTVLFAYFIHSASAEANQSGLFDLISLLRTDSAAMLGNWHNFVLSVAEVIPVFSVAGVFCALFGMILSAAYSAQTWYITRAAPSLS